MSERIPYSGLIESVTGIEHAFGTLPDPIPEPFKADWDSLKPSWKQVHGTACAEARAPRADLGEVDAVWTRAPGTPIAVVTADCVPILLAKRDGSAIAAVHAGWRGTKARILRKLFDALSVEGERPAQWIAAIGPAIGPCCYEVSQDLAEEFAREFKSLGSSLAVPRHRVIDLPSIAHAELDALGVYSVEIIRECTRCSKLIDGSPKYRSYRREGGSTRQWSLITIEPQ